MGGIDFYIKSCRDIGEVRDTYRLSKQLYHCVRVDLEELKDLQREPLR